MRPDIKLKSEDTTETTRFILPMLATNDKLARFFINNWFINAYVGCKEPYLQDKIILNYWLTPKSEFFDFEKELMTMSGFEGDYDVNSKRNWTMLYTYKIPDELTEDYQKFKQGKYSELSPKLKMQILYFWGLSNKGLMYDILHKGTKAKFYWDARKLKREKYCAEGEYWYRPKKGIEIFDFNKFKSAIEAADLEKIRLRIIT